MVSKGTFEFIGYVALAGAAIGYNYFRDPFMDLLSSYILPLITVFGTPILAAAILYIVVVVVLLRGIVRIIGWLFAA